MPNGKSVLFTAAIALAVVVAHDRVKSGGAAALKPRLGN